MLGDARTGQVRTVLTERDSTWVEVVDDLVWLDGGKNFTWVSERDGWKHVYVVSRDGRTSRLVTKGDYDVLEVKGIDPKGGWLYYIASPENPVQRYLFRTRLDGKGKPERLSPVREPGSHTYDMAPNYRYAIETYSSLGNPPIVAPDPPARTPAGADAGGQPGSSGPGHRPQAPHRGVAHHPGGRRGEDPGGVVQAGGLRLDAGSTRCSSSSTAGPETPRSRTNGADTTSGTRC